MSLKLKNSYLLLEPVEDVSSQFAKEASNKFKVAFNYMNFPTGYDAGEIVYVLNTLGEMNVEGKKYTVAEASEVVAYVA